MNISKNYFLSIALAISAIWISVGCQEEESTSFSQEEQAYFNQAKSNGMLAQEGFLRSFNFMKAWLAVADSTTGLIPQNLSEGGKCIWNAHNSAADNYPFMVLTAFMLDQELYRSTMIQTLKKEKEITSRIQSLPDAYNICEGAFADEMLDTANVIFGTSEYIKDGILPITEYMGYSPWQDRMMEMLDDLSEIITVADGIKGHFFGNSADTEINGELLQILCRVYWMTGKQEYLDWAIQIGDFYLENPKVNLAQSERLRLRDHGCEIIGGLSELYLALHYVDQGKKMRYQKPLYTLYDRVLEVGTNADGIFYNEVNMLTGEVLDSALVDNWGYLYDAYYSVFLVDQHEAYRQVALKPLSNLKANYQHYNWENWSSDGFADAIESALNLYNREPLESTAQWMDKEIQMMWSLQDSNYRENPAPFLGNGIIEGWHGDGNFARTSLMYSLWKTKGCTIDPWQASVNFGAEDAGDTLYLSISVEAPWAGKLFFDSKRHEEVFKLPIDYPRINQFPEWFCLVEEATYLVSINGEDEKAYSREQLKKGLSLSLGAGSETDIRIRSTQ